MSYSATVFKVMIASPSDVGAARGMAREVIRAWNNVHSEDKGIILMPIGWETHSAPSMEAPAQEVINRQVLADCDLLVAAFWTRLGTPTDSSPSGTVEEIEKHLKAGKPAMIYFSDEPVRPDSVDEAQYRALKEFRRACEKRGLIETFSHLGEFQDKFSRQLAMTVLSKLTDLALREEERTQAEGGEPPAKSILTDISDEAKRLLIEASKDPNGIIMCVKSMGGLTIQTNGISLAERGNARSEALWQRAVNQLVALGLISDRGRKGEVYQLTADGYEVADLLSRKA